MKSNIKKNAAIEVVKAAAEKFPGTFICRDRVEEFTGGAVKARNLANLDSLGLGPEGTFYLGRRKCYAIPGLVDWLISRLEV